MGSIDDIAGIYRAERKYPWRRWTNGDAYRATYSAEVKSTGDWFYSKPESFIVILRDRAKKSGMKVHIRSGVDEAGIPTVGFQFYKPTESA